MAVVSDRKQQYERRLAEMSKMAEGGTGMETGDLEAEVQQLKMMIKDEEAKMEKYKVWS
jgi:hypothetical protein